MSENAGQEAREALARGDPFSALQLLKELGTGSDADTYLQVLALARLGETTRALQLYQDAGLGRVKDEDVRAIKGRLLKDMARSAKGEQRREFLRRASLVYREAAELNGGYFALINAATTAFLAEEEFVGRRIAGELLQNPDIRAPSSYYAAATRGEALLILGEPLEAGQVLLEGLSLPGSSLASRAGTVRQLTLICDHLDLCPEVRAHLLEKLRPPPVMFFCGHMFVADDPSEASLAERIDSELQRLDINVGYGALAAGADILFAESLLKRGGWLHVILPFSEDDFLAQSVVMAGNSWQGRYRSCLDRATSVTFASRMEYVGDPEMLAYGSRLAMGLTLLHARQLETTAVQLAVWDGRPSAVAGTGRDVRDWRALGETSVVIDAPDLDRRFARPEQVSLPRSSHRANKAILFADFAGFSRLKEGSLPSFHSTVFGQIADVLGRHDEAVACRNSWGDAVFAIVDDPLRAARIALEIQAALDPSTLTNAGLPETGGLRMSLHYGPVYCDDDPIRKSRTFFGTEITLAARIEPRVPVGAIYTTQPFAAIVTAEHPGSVQLGYVGSIDLAKDYGQWPIYRLEAVA